MEFEDIPDFHAVVTIQLCELIDTGFCDDELTGWKWPKYSDEQDAELRNKIVEHYYFREIALAPPPVWKHEFIRKMKEIMPKYIPLYKLMDESPELFGGNSEYYKSRDMFSNFPQSELKGDEDYASSGTDREFQRIKQDDIINIAKRLEDYEDIDLRIIDDIEPLFSCLFTVNMNDF